LVFGNTLPTSEPLRRQVSDLTAAAAAGLGSPQDYGEEIKSNPPFMISSQSLEPATPPDWRVSPGRTTADRQNKANAEVANLLFLGTSAN
jgi:hypothetical protein